MQGLRFENKPKFPWILITFKRNIFGLCSVIYRVVLVFWTMHLRGSECILPHHCVSCLQPVELCEHFPRLLPLNVYHFNIQKRCPLWNMPSIIKYNLRNFREIQHLRNAAWYKPNIRGSAFTIFKYFCLGDGMH